MKRDLAIRALRMAISLRSPPKGCIFHSDRGSQNCSHGFQKILREHGFQVSMSAKGNCYDNAVLTRENSPLDCFLILLKDGGQPPAMVYFNNIETDQQVQAVA